MDTVLALQITVGVLSFVIFGIGAFWFGKLYASGMQPTVPETEGEKEEDDNLPDTTTAIPTAERGEDPERAVYADSPTPWVKLMSDEYDPTVGFKITLDWNAAFVERLKENGYTGVDDNQMVQKWLAQTAFNVAKDMDEHSFQTMLSEDHLGEDDDGSLPRF